MLCWSSHQCMLGLDQVTEERINSSWIYCVQSDIAAWGKYVETFFNLNFALTLGCRFVFVCSHQVLDSGVLAIINLSGRYFSALGQLGSCDYFFFLMSFIKVGPPRLHNIPALHLPENLQLQQQMRWPGQMFNQNRQQGQRLCYTSCFMIYCIICGLYYSNVQGAVQKCVLQEISGVWGHITPTKAFHKVSQLELRSALIYCELL